MEQFVIHFVLFFTIPVGRSPCPWTRMRVLVLNRLVNRMHRGDMIIYRIDCDIRNNSMRKQVKE